MTVVPVLLFTAALLLIAVPLCVGMVRALRRAGHTIDRILDEELGGRRVDVHAPVAVPARAEQAATM